MLGLAAMLLSVVALDAPATVTGRCPDGRVWTTSTAEQTHMLGLLNQARAERARLPLSRIAVLDRMAMAHVADMACRNYFSHDSPERRNIQARLKQVAGADEPAWQRLAEILGTSSTAPRQVQQWLESRGHRGALLEGAHDDVGVGMVRIANGSRQITYWAVEFIGSQR